MLQVVVCCRFSDSGVFCVGGVADGLGVQILHRPGAQYRVGDTDLALGVAAAARVGPHPPPDGAHSHTGI